MPDEPSSVRHNPDVAFEHTDVSMSVVTLTVTGTLAGTLIIVLLLSLVFFYLRSQYASIPDVYGRPALLRSTQSEPVLQQSPTQDLQVWKQEEERKLTTYRWTDRPRGLAAIPVTRAVDLVLQKGLPKAEPMPGLELGIPRAGHRQTGFDPLVALPEESQ